MFDVLVFVYENYWRGDACPQSDHLERKLNAVGFEPQEIHDALIWLNGLSVATRGTELAVADAAPDVFARPYSGATLDQSPTSMRVYSVAEQNRLGSECLGFISFLVSAGVLPAPMREIVVDRAMASNADSLCLEDLKIIVLMVYWSLGEEPDALVLDELCDDATDRIAH
jgi:Smg protein